jgi:hypothetical protein
MNAPAYLPDFEAECRECGTSPTVIVVGHPHRPDTELCGICFFRDRAMIDWSFWPDTIQDQE